MEVRTMSRSLTRLALSIFLAGICVGLAASAAAQTTPKVTAVRLTVSKTPSPSQPCGAFLNVDTNFSISGAGTVWYRFDGPRGASYPGKSEGTMKFSDAGEGGPGTVVNFSTGTKGQFRVEVAIQTPDGKHGPAILSNVVPIDFKCGGAATGESPVTNQPPSEGPRVTNVSLTFPPSLTVWKYSGACPLKLDLYGHITVTGSGQVRVQMMPEGHPGIWPKEVLDFSGPGTKHVHKILPIGSNVWKPGSHHAGWYILKVLSPQPMESNKAEYDITCR